MTAFERIMAEQVPAWSAKFDQKSRDYNSATTGWEPHTFLGVRGQFADVWRKIGKLKKALWDEEELTGEQPREIIQDLISHLFLTLDLLGQQEDKSLRAFEDAHPAVETEEVESCCEEQDQQVKVLRIPPEGPERLGIGSNQWEILKGLADAVHNSRDPRILESQGYFLQIMSGVQLECKECRFERALETGILEFHTYVKGCKYRIRKRRTT